MRRPMNAFMLWSKTWRKKIAKDHPDVFNADVSKMLGKIWKEQPPDEKQVYINESRRLREEHKSRHPEFRYASQPVKTREQLMERIFTEQGLDLQDIDPSTFDWNCMRDQVLCREAQQRDMRQSAARLPKIVGTGHDKTNPSPPPPGSRQTS